MMSVRQHAGAPLYAPKQSSDIMSLALGFDRRDVVVLCIRRAPLTPLGEFERLFDSNAAGFRVSQQIAELGGNAGIYESLTLAKRTNSLLGDFKAVLLSCLLYLLFILSTSPTVSSVSTFSYLTTRNAS